ncbi:MAG: 3'-5' exonuclease, partial [Bacteroidota bacterium]
MYLFFDVETVGFPKKWNRPHTDTFNWPRMVSIAFQRYGERRQHLESYEAIIQPEGFEIPIEAEQIHGISTEKAKEDGVPIEDALRAFAAAIDKADYIIAHN